MRKDTITLGADVGGPEADVPTLSWYMPLRKLLAKYCVGPYSQDIDEFAFVLRIDGRVASWNFEGCEELKLNRRRRYITIDIGIPQRRWQSSEGNSLGIYLVDCLEAGLRLMADKLQETKLDVNTAKLFADFKIVRHEYLNSLV